MMLEVGIGEEYTREAVGLQDNQDLIFCKKHNLTGDDWIFSFWIYSRV